MFESLQHLLTGFGIALTIHNLFYCLMGAILGTLIGVLPGLGPIAGIALLIWAQTLAPQGIVSEGRVVAGVVVDSATGKS